MLLQKVKDYINGKSGLRHWYQVKFIYKDKQDRLILDWKIEIGLLNMNQILKHRDLKKFQKLLGKDKSIKQYQCNGKLGVEVLCYLGHFKA